MAEETETSAEIDEKSKIYRESIVAYDYFVDEIKREDGVVASRLAAGLALQGLLLASCAIVLGNGISKDAFQLETVVATRRLFLILIVMTGFLSSIITYFTMRDSQKALDAIRDKRKTDIENRVFLALPIFPNPPVEERYRWASSFPHVSLLFFTLIWSGAMIVCTYVVIGEGKIRFITPVAVQQSETVKLPKP